MSASSSPDIFSNFSQIESQSDSLFAPPLQILNAFLKSSEDPLFVVDREGRYLLVGEAGASVFGLEASQMVGKTNAELGFALETIADLNAQTEQVFRTGLSVTGTTMVSTPSGVKIYEHRFSPVFERDEAQNGEVIAMLCSAREITERENLQEQQRNNERERRLSLNAARIGAWSFDLTTETILWGEGLERLFGLLPGEFDGSPSMFLSLVHPLDRDMVDAEMERSIREDHDFQHEIRVVWPDESVHWILAQGEISRDAEGNPIQLSGIIQDITKRKEVELEHSRLATIVETSEDAIFSITLEGNVMTWNPAAERMFGYKADAMIGESIIVLFPENRREEVPVVLNRLKQGEQIALHETVHQRADRTLLDVSVTISPMRNDMERIMGASVIARDVSQRKQHEREIEIIMSGAQCLLWSAEILDTEHSFYLHWIFRIADEKAAQRFLPLSLLEKETYSDAWYRCRLPEDRDAYNRLGAAAIRAGKSYAQEFRCQGQDGKIHWVREEVRIETLKAGKHWRAVAVCTEISSQKQMEADLRESEARARFLADSIPHLVWTTQPNGTIDYFNRRCVEYTGATLEELFGWGWEHVIHPEDYPGLLKVYLVGMKTGTAFEHQFRIKRFDDEYRWHQGRVLPRRDEKGELVRWYGTSTDIDDFIKAESSLRESEQRLQAALHAGAMGIWEWNMITDALLWSSETERLFGIEEGTFEGTYGAYQAFLHPEDRELVRDSIKKAVEHHIIFENEHRILLKDGTLRWVSGKGRAYYNREGQAVRMLGTVADITDRKRLESQYLQSQKMEGIGRLAGGIAHDFNNLLSVILGYAEMTEMEIGEGSDLLLNIHNIQTAATRAAKLTAQLLAFARRQVSEARIIQPNAVISEMQPMLKPLIREDITLTFSLSEGAGSVKADPTQIEQIIVNLVVNARDALPRGGRIIIQTESLLLAEHYLQEQMQITPGDYVLLSVSDTGTGMTEEVKNRLFEPFFTTKDVGKGTGLGLATVYGIVKQSAGYIFVYSEEGKGTTIKIYLPRVSEILPAAQEKATKGVRGGGTETLLVVEDEQLVREITIKTLQRHGYTVLEAENGEVALRVVQDYKGRIDLVVTDAIMPVMNGKELADRLKVVLPGIPVMYVSGYTEEVTSVQGIMPEGTFFLQKPFTASGLASKVRQVLEAASVGLSPM